MKLVLIMSFIFIGNVFAAECFYKDGIKYCPVNNENQCVSKVKTITRWRTKVVYRDKTTPSTSNKVVKKTVTKYPNRNSLSLMGINAQTKVERDVRDQNGEVRINQSDEIDFGIMYQRDFFRNTRFSIGGSLNGTGFVGVGLNF